jgi:hypothetical protein
MFTPLVGEWRLISSELALRLSDVFSNYGSDYYFYRRITQLVWGEFVTFLVASL